MHGLYLLWWVHERQIPPALVATILAAGDLAIVLLEIPTGRFADRFGHRASLLIGSFVQVAGMLCCWLGEGIPALIVASVLVGLGDTFRSGADEALLYRTCVALDREGDFQRIEAGTRTVELGALVALTLAGGVIAQTWGFATAWLAEATLCAVGLGIAWAMTEPPARAEPEDAVPGEARTPIVSLAMARLILPASCLGATAGAAAFLAQTSGLSDPWTMTMLVAGITLVEAAGSAAATRLPAAGTRAQAIIAALGGLILAVGLALPAAFLFAVFTLSFLLGLATPLRAAAIQRLSADDVRAQAASTASACDMALSTITLPVAGVFRHRR